MGLHYISQFSFTAKYVSLIEKIAKAHCTDFVTVHIQSREGVQKAHTPFTTFSLFYNGEFVTHEIQSEIKLEKIFADRGL